MEKEKGYDYRSNSQPYQPCDVIRLTRSIVNVQSSPMEFEN